MDICFVYTKTFACLRSVVPGGTHNVPCDHAGVSYSICVISFT